MNTFLAKAIRWKSRLRWIRHHAVDRFLPPPKNLRCPLCAETAARAQCRIRESRCIFDGGRLERYECPACGGVFGTWRMLTMSPRGMEREYRELYATYSEGDSTDNEIRTFHVLEPRPGGVYLNYGCGRWSKSVDRLRAMGHEVYGYEPFSADSTSSSHLVRSEAELRAMKFDGIFSNNLIEHLQDPAVDLRFMASLLRNHESTMAHATTCYEYRDEFTRFHVVFFLGNSLTRLCARSGLTYEDIDLPMDHGQRVKRFRLASAATDRAAAQAESHAR